LNKNILNDKTTFSKAIQENFNIKERELSSIKEDYNSLKKELDNCFKLNVDYESKIENLSNSNEAEIIKRKSLEVEILNKENELSNEIIKHKKEKNYYWFKKRTIISFKHLSRLSFRLS
jgi:hypothetical protein